ncbi:hypothetical protein QOY93_11560 [Leclercia adecarboxylata]|uniref:hypothetical protein n=1 Tax=Leclercia adecarboxylata TaxID=83655 RepID=UPI00254EED75|nr:hypothetical protein [Leclercia adecarboxylata]MDK4745994.1 hypothetical protein [Leclercia adecarboxylata]
MQLIKIIPLMALVGLLSACDSSDDYVTFTSDFGASKGQSVIVNVSHFPDYITVGGERVYPDKQNAVSGQGSGIAMYEFSKTTDKSDDYTTRNIFIDVKLMRAESNNLKMALGWIEQPDKEYITAYRTLIGAINYGSYSYQDITNSTYNESVVIDGEAKGWSK